MTVSLQLTEITVNDGTSVRIPDGGVVLIVGSNNGGESQALRDIRLAMTSDDAGVVITRTSSLKSGTGLELAAHFARDHAIVNTPNGDQVVLGSRGAQSVAAASEWWDSRSWTLVADYFIQLADTESRLAASRPVAAVSLLREHPSPGIQSLYERPDVEARLKAIAEEAFGVGLILDVWTGGNEWCIRMGDIQPPQSPRPDVAYLSSLSSLPVLSTQGDGVRSLIGLLTLLLTGRQSVSLVDEPEAFLHPPQANYLGRILATDAARPGRSLVVATHSSDLVHGVLEGDAPTTVVRLRRDGSVNRASVLANSAVRELWNDPLLRYSRLLEGLFSDVVVVCESEADCKFFSAVLDQAMKTNNGARMPDVCFTSCGGKDRIHAAVSALRAAEVPVHSIGDFDVLNSWARLERLVVASGGSASDFEADWNVLKAALESQFRKPDLDLFKRSVVAEVQGLEDLSDQSLRAVRGKMKMGTPWDCVKNTGLNGVPKGNVYAAAKNLLERLASVNIHLVPVGEMEDFVPQVSGHGTAWVSTVLAGGFHTRCAAAKDFMRSVVP